MTVGELIKKLQEMVKRGSVRETANVMFRYDGRLDYDIEIASYESSFNRLVIDLEGD